MPYFKITIFVGQEKRRDREDEDRKRKREREDRSPSPAKKSVARRRVVVSDSEDEDWFLSIFLPLRGGVYHMAIIESSCGVMTSALEYIKPIGTQVLRLVIDSYKHPQFNPISFNISIPTSPISRFFALLHWRAVFILFLDQIMHPNCVTYHVLALLPALA